MTHGPKLYTRFLVVAGAGALLVGCATEQRSERPSPTRPSVAAKPLARAPSPAVYLSTAASMDLYEVRAGELAMTRARSARLRDFGRMMVSAHRGMAAQLSFAGRRLNLLPATRLQPREQAMLDQLRAASDFDAVYKRQQIAAHEAALRLHTTYAARGSSPTLRPVATAAAPNVRRHLDMLRRM